MKTMILKIENKFEVSLPDIFDCAYNFLIDHIIGNGDENNISKEYVLNWINTEIPEEDILCDMFAAICCVDSSNLKEILIDNLNDFYQYFINKYNG